MIGSLPQAASATLGAQCRIYEANRISLNYLIEIPAAYCRQIVISVIDFVYKTSVCRMVGLKFLRGSAVG